MEYIRQDYDSAVPIDMAVDELVGVFGTDG